jgi:hypothetical protein
MGRKTPHCIEERRHPHIPLRPAAKTAPNARLQIGYACKPVEKRSGDNCEIMTAISNGSFIANYVHGTGGPIDIGRMAAALILIVNSGRATIVGEGKIKRIEDGAVVSIPAGTSYTITPDKETLFQFYVIHPR